MAKSINDLIRELQALPNKDRTVTVVVGDEEDNTIDTADFELHHAECDEHPLEIFVHEELKGAVAMKTEIIAPPPKEDGGTKPLFRVVYVIDVNAKNSLEAAKQTYQTVINPASLAPVLRVMNSEGEVELIDLAKG